jgi:hypothetical protein
VAAIVRTIFAQPDHHSAMTQLHEVARMLHPKSPLVAELLQDAAEDVLAHLHFPREHRRRLHSTNPLERLHKEIKRRTRVVGIFPTRDSLMRMVGTLLAEQDDEWQVSDRRYFSVGSMAKVDALEGGEDKGPARSDRMRSEDGVAQSPPLDGTRPEPNAFANHVDLGNLPSSLHPSDRLRMARVIRPPRSILPRRHGQRSRQPLDISERHIESRGRTAPKMFYQRGVLAHLPVPFDLSAPAGTKSDAS